MKKIQVALSDEAHASLKAIQKRFKFPNLDTAVETLLLKASTFFKDH